MQVTLFRALKSINIVDEVAQKAVAVVEERIEMSVANAVKPLENKIDTLSVQMATQIGALTTKIDTIGTGTQTAISNLSAEVKSAKWVAAGTTGLIALFGVAAGVAAKISF